MYSLDPTAASKADNIGAYINDTGKYQGTFIRAEKLVSTNKGTHGIGFSFRDQDGRETRFDIWTMKSNNEPLPGMNQVNAIMACLQVRNMEPKLAQVKKWDNDAGAETIQSAECFVELMNKPIGLLLRSEEYEKMKDGYPTGEHGWRIGFFAVFQFGTELMASEILARKTKPEQLSKVIALLADKPLKKKSGTTGRSQSTGMPPTGFADDDLADLPF